MAEGPSGWVMFASIVLIFAGIMRVLDSIWAFRFNGALPDNLDGGALGTNLTTYAVVYLVVGALLIVTGIYVVMRSHSSAGWASPPASSAVFLARCGCRTTQSGRWSTWASRCLSCMRWLPTLNRRPRRLRTREHRAVEFPHTGVGVWADAFSSVAGVAGAGSKGTVHRRISGATGRYPRSVSPVVESGSAGGAGEEGCDDVGGVPVEGLAGPVVAHGRARVGVGGGFLDVPEWDAGVEGGGDEAVAQAVW
jgi:hypothetical protein